MRITYDAEVDALYIRFLLANNEQGSCQKTKPKTNIVGNCLSQG